MDLREVVLATLLVPAAASAADCAIEGELIWWIADVCMARQETDDEVAASDCIRAETARSSRSACETKHQLKRELCDLSIARGTRTGQRSACIADPAFRGPTVRHRGVGG